MQKEFAHITSSLLANDKVLSTTSPYSAKNTVTAVTTVALVQKLYQQNIITTKEQVEEFISSGATDGIVKILVSEEYDLEPQEKTLLCSDVADKIVTSYGMRIYY